MFENFVENQDKTNFVLTVFFILIPFLLLSLWSFYIHITQPDIIPIFKNVPYIFRVLVSNANKFVNINLYTYSKYKFLKNFELNRYFFSTYEYNYNHKDL